MGDRPPSSSCIDEESELCSRRRSRQPGRSPGGPAAGVLRQEQRRRRPGEKGGSRGTPPKRQDFPCARAEGHLRPSERPRETPRPRQATARPFRQQRSPRPQQTAAEPLQHCQTSPVQGRPRLDPGSLPGLIQPAGTKDANLEAGPHDGCDDTGGFAGVQLQCWNRPEGTRDHNTAGCGDLSGSHAQ
jgi:hypothetical protein